MTIFRDFQAVLTMLCGGFLVVSLFGLHPALPYISVLFGSYFALKTTWEALRERQIDVNFLMVFAAAGAIIVNHALDAAALLFLFSLSSTLEAFAMARTKSAIEGLIKLRPEEAILVSGGEDHKVRVETLSVGDQVRVLPYDQIPTDGTVVSGLGAIDASAMSGESKPVAVEPGSLVLAGTQNLDSMLIISVTARVGDTTLDKVVELVQSAQDNKASGERISAWFGQRYTFLVVGIFAVSLVARLLLGIPGQDAFYASLILLVALSPCAVVISTPATTLSALAWAARNGVLIRGGEFIEGLGRIKVALLDKTGTLTTGKPNLVEVCVCSGVPDAVGASGSLCVDEHACWSHGQSMSNEARDLLQFAAIGEQYSTHPIAEAILKAARQQELEIPEASDQKSVSGLGVEAHWSGKRIRVGQRRFFETAGSVLPADFAVHAEELQRKGMTVAILEVDGRLAAFGLSDAPKPGAKTVLRALQEHGVEHIAMLTGDTKETAAAVAAELGIADHRGGLLPEDKEIIVAEFENAGRPVLMVGDGINDAPSLARATVGVAMGGLGSDIALNAADIVLMQDRLERLPELLGLGKKTNLIIKQNLFFATGVIGVLTLSSLFWHLPLPLAVIGHEGSTVLVILNGLRLLKGP